MKRILQWGCLTLTLLLVIAPTAPIQAQGIPTVTRAITASGGRISSGSFTVVGVIGQPAVGWMGGGSTLAGGFLPVDRATEPPVGTFKLYLPLLQR